MDDRRAVGIGIPAYQERDGIAATLVSALEQDVPCAVVVSDNGSTDGTPDVCREVGAEHPDRALEVVVQPTGLGLAGNFRFLRDVLAPRHERFVWLGARDRLPSDYVRRLVEVSERESHQGVGVALAAPGTVRWRIGPSPEGEWREREERLPDLSDRAFGGDKVRQLVAMVRRIESCTELHGVWDSDAVLAAPCEPIWAWDHAAIFTAACLGRVVVVPDVVYVRREPWTPERRHVAQRRRAAAGMDHSRRAFLRWVRHHRRGVRRCAALDARERRWVALAVTLAAWARFGGWFFRSVKHLRLAPVLDRAADACVRRVRSGPAPTGPAAPSGTAA